MLFSLIRPFIIISLSIGLISTTATAETIYKWQNQAGKWSYGTTPPVGVEAIEVKTSSGKAKQPKIPELPAEAQKMMAEHKQTCDRAKSNLAALNSDAVIQRTNADGNNVTLTQEERTIEKDKAQAAIDHYCLGITPKKPSR